ncbi:hypothetical protein OF83DRAFT_1088970 [Amylostereum chailletii]|nr:hypothetical protein OF83DRAFT_1088970 [Amylostereum chailletii]
MGPPRRKASAPSSAPTSVPPTSAVPPSVESALPVPPLPNYAGAPLDPSTLLASSRPSRVKANLRPADILKTIASRRSSSEKRADNTQATQTKATKAATVAAARKVKAQVAAQAHDEILRVSPQSSRRSGVPLALPPLDPHALTVLHVAASSSSSSVIIESPPTSPENPIITLSFVNNKKAIAESIGHGSFTALASYTMYNTLTQLHRSFIAIFTPNLEVAVEDMLVRIGRSSGPSPASQTPVVLLAYADWPGQHQDEFKQENFIETVINRYDTGCKIAWSRYYDYTKKNGTGALFSELALKKTPGLRLSLEEGGTDRLEAHNLVHLRERNGPAAIVIPFWGYPIQCSLKKYYTGYGDNKLFAKSYIVQSFLCTTWVVYVVALEYTLVNCRVLYLQCGPRVIYKPCGAILRASKAETNQDDK